ncbi:MAG: BrnT family toxin [Elusimicrobiota bacterium]|nr:BrnT family toxin [Elusimicrobiota bacterium]
MEKRYYAFGATDRRRKLTIVFTIRNRKIRVVSARDMSRRERGIYDKKL